MSKFIYIVFLMVVSREIVGCKSRAESNLKIVNGSDVLESDKLASNVGYLIPYYEDIPVVQGHAHCTGTAISPWVIITALHCVDKHSYFPPITFMSVDKQTAYLDLEHARFFKDSKNRFFDIALIPTLTPLSLKQNIGINNSLESLPKKILMYGASPELESVNPIEGRFFSKMRKGIADVKNFESGKSNYMDDSRVSRRTAAEADVLEKDVSTIHLDRSSIRSVGICGGDSGGSSFGSSGNDEIGSLIGVHSFTKVRRVLSVCKKQIFLSKNLVNVLQNAFRRSTNMLDAYGDAGAINLWDVLACTDAWDSSAIQGAIGGIGAISNRPQSTNYKRIRLGKSCLDITSLYQDHSASQDVKSLPWYFAIIKDIENQKLACPEGTQFLTRSEAEAMINNDTEGSLNAVFWDDQRTTTRGLLKQPNGEFAVIDNWCHSTNDDFDVHLSPIAGDIERANVEIKTNQSTLTGSVLSLDATVNLTNGDKPKIPQDQAKELARNILNATKDEFKNPSQVKLISSTIERGNFLQVLALDGVLGKTSFLTQYSKFVNSAIVTDENKNNTNPEPNILLLEAIS